MFSSLKLRRRPQSSLPASGKSGAVQLPHQAARAMATPSPGAISTTMTEVIVNAMERNKLRHAAMGNIPGGA
jgi:hypothetical protein